MGLHIQVSLRITKSKGKVPIKLRLISGLEYGRKDILKGKVSKLVLDLRKSQKMMR